MTKDEILVEALDILRQIEAPPPLGSRIKRLMAVIEAETGTPPPLGVYVSEVIKTEEKFGNK